MAGWLRPRERSIGNSNDKQYMTRPCLILLFFFSSDESFLNYFAVSTTSTLTVSSDVYKHGTTSLKWTWQKGDALKLDFDHEPVEKRALIHGGVKLWLYLVRNIPGGRMTLSFYTNLLAYFRRGLHGPECQFDISLDFRGWRGIWVAFDECRLRTPMFPLHRLVLRAPAGHDGEIYIDLLRIIRNKIRRQSRDEIVPPIRGRISLPNSFWQQTYRWSLSKPKTTVFNELELNDEQMEKLRDIRYIPYRPLGRCCVRFIFPRNWRALGVPPLKVNNGG